MLADKLLGIAILKEALEKNPVSAGYKRQVSENYVARDRCSMRGYILSIIYLVYYHYIIFSLQM